MVMKQMKRIIALLLVFSMCLSLAGCYVDEEDLKELVVEAGKEIAGDMVEEAVGDLENSINQKTDELKDGLSQQFGELDSLSPVAPDYDQTQGENPSEGGDAPLSMSAIEECAAFIELAKPPYAEYVWTHQFSYPDAVEYYTDKFAAYKSVPWLVVEDDVIAAMKTLGYTIVTYDANGGSSAPESQSYLDAWRDNILTTAIVGSRLRITDELPINPGYHFVGWGETPNATTAAYKPGEKLSKDAPSMALYAIWEICNSHTYEINMDESTIICTNCAAPIPMDEFRFSDFWKLRYPKKSKLEQLSEKQLESALNDYIKIKTLMTAKELKDTQRLVDWSNVGGSNSFQLIGSLVDQFSYDLKHVTLQNTEAFYLLFNSLVVATGEQGYDNLATKIINGVNNTITVTSFGEFVTAAVNANLKAEKLELTKNQGKQYTYFAHEDLINLAVANTRTIAALATFLGNFCNISINAPSVDVNQLTTAFADIAKTNKLAEIYRILSLPISTNPSQLNVNEMLPTGVSGSFAEINIYSQENIYNAMKGGPTAAEFVNHIPSILENISDVHGDKAKVEFALWYYYGWRMQYDYARFIEGILNNWI